MSIAEMFNREEVRKGRTRELDESHAQSGVCEMDTSAGQENGRSEANNLIFIWNVTSHADETEIMGGDRSVSNTHGSIRLSGVGSYSGETVTQSMMAILEEAGHCAPGNAVR